MKNLQDVAIERKKAIELIIVNGLVNDFNAKYKRHYTNASNLMLIEYLKEKNLLGAAYSPDKDYQNKIAKANKEQPKEQRIKFTREMFEELQTIDRRIKSLKEKLKSTEEEKKFFLNNKKPLYAVENRDYYNDRMVVRLTLEHEECKEMCVAILNKRMENINAEIAKLQDRFENINYVDIKS